MVYLRLDSHYENIPYQCCGKSVSLLPRISLGFWHDFSGVDIRENERDMGSARFVVGFVLRATSLH